LEEDLVEKILLGASVFRDERSLFPEFLPQKLPRREEEISRYLKNFLDVKKKFLVWQQIFVHLFKKRDLLLLI